MLASNKSVRFSRYSYESLIDLVEALWGNWDESAVLTDAAGNILTCTPAFEALVGWPLGRLRRKKPKVNGLGLMTDELSAKLWGLLKAGKPWRGVLQNRRQDGTVWWGYTEIFPIVRHSTIEAYWARVRSVFAPDNGARAVSDTIFDGLTLLPVFQPLVTVADGAPWALEALIRPHFFDVAISPLDLYTMAESLDLVEAVDRWVLTAISRALAHKIWPTQYQLSLNVRMATLAHPEWLDSFLAESKVPQHCIIVEISERDALPGNIEGWGHLREWYPAIRFALDDWGSGHNDMARLIELRPEWIKVDRTWLVEAQHDDAAQVLLRDFVTWAGRTLRTRVILEGIETVDDVQLASWCGITLGQGYLWGRPRPWEDLSWLRLDEKP